jgi:hypothetical protein
MLGNETGLAASIGCTCCVFLNQDLQHLGYACFSGKNIYLKPQLCLHILCKGTGLTASIGCTCVLFYQTSFLCLHELDRIYSTRGCTFFPEGIQAQLCHTCFVLNKINSIYRMHLSVLLNQNLQHLGVHLFFGKENLFTCTVVPTHTMNGTGLTASIGCTCQVFLHAQLCLHMLCKETRINIICRLHLCPFFFRLVLSVFL